MPKNSDSDDNDSAYTPGCTIKKKIPKKTKNTISKKNLTKSPISKTSKSKTKKPTSKKTKPVLEKKRKRLNLLLVLP